MSDFEQRMEQRVDKIDVTVARIDERLKYLQETLEAHDAKGAKALEVATVALQTAEEAKAPLIYLDRSAKLAKWLGTVGGGVILIYHLVTWLKG